MNVKNSLERLKKLNEENRTPVRVSRGLLKSALMEIEMQSKLHGESFATRMVLGQLKEVLGVKP
ncbi:hypothetical protein DP196_24150 [Enterobacter hormaechei subsp. steigerwaltii]|uniref:hypothetical protein n=1 Tax=Enterobacter hormaechei TaxID=158836 RepID=UPI000DCEC5D9|nr:hypothetical protein [Enterobacter hormaechei]RAY85875.1 hypothetical protein DP196_24150 [Enterobacter hormaechei subsp. steigerwaltii]